MSRTLLLVISYLLIVGINFVPLGVVWYVLERVTDRTEVLIVTLAGVLYAMIDLTARGNDAEVRGLRREVAEGRAEMRRLLDLDGKGKSVEGFEVRERRASREFHDAAQRLIPVIMMMTVLILCLVRFFAVI